MYKYSWKQGIGCGKPRELFPYKLIEYINENILYYIDTILLSIINYFEDEDVVIELFSLDDVTEEYMIKIIDKCNFKATYLSKYDLEIWSKLFIKKRADKNWENYLDYYDSFGLDEHLIEYLNLYVGSITEAPILDNEEKKKIYYGFILDIIVCKEFKDENLKYCLVSGLSINELDHNNISDGKIRTLVTQKALLFNEHNYKYIFDYYDFVLLEFIEINSEEFLTIIDNLDFENIIVDEILSSKALSKAFKGRLVITLNSKNYVCEDNSIASKIIQVIIDSENTITIQSELLLSLLERDVQEDYKINLIISQLDSLSSEDVKDCLITLGGEFVKIVTLRGQALLKKNEKNQLLLDKLESMKIFSSQKDEENRIRVHAFRK